MDGSVRSGKVLAERVARIAPDCEVAAEVCFIESTAERLLACRDGSSMPSMPPSTSA